MDAWELKQAMSDVGFKLSDGQVCLLLNALTARFQILLLSLVESGRMKLSMARSLSALSTQHSSAAGDGSIAAFSK